MASVANPQILCPWDLPFRLWHEGCGLLTQPCEEEPRQSELPLLRCYMMLQLRYLHYPILHLDSCWGFLNCNRIRYSGHPGVLQSMSPQSFKKTCGPRIKIATSARESYCSSTASWPITKINQHNMFHSSLMILFNCALLWLQAGWVKVAITLALKLQEAIRGMHRELQDT